MANQQESKIENFAFDYLKNYYKQQYTSDNILVSQTEKTKRGLIVDGMLVFKKTADESFVAGISMKQTEALTSLLINYKKNGLGKIRLLTPLLLIALCFAIGKTTGNVFTMVIAPVMAAPLGYMLHTHLLKKLRFRKLEAITDFVKRLPADEQWIGLSISSLVFRNNLLAKTLLEICREKGIGLITVGQRSKVILMQRPTLKTSRRGDYLSQYVDEANIRRAIIENHVLRVA